VAATRFSIPQNHGVVGAHCAGGTTRGPGIRYARAKPSPNVSRFRQTERDPEAGGTNRRRLPPPAQLRSYFRIRERRVTPNTERCHPVYLYGCLHVASGNDHRCGHMIHVAACGTLNLRLVLPDQGRRPDADRKFCGPCERVPLAMTVSVAMRKWLWRNCRDAGDRRGGWCPDRGFCNHVGRAILRLLLFWFLTWAAWPLSACP
jgi:hypothetical protein